MKPSDDKIDILQNLEFSIVEVWRAHPEMTDYTALRAYEAAFRFYRAEERGQAAKAPDLSGLDAAAFEAVKGVCEFRLGRGTGDAAVPEGVGRVSLEKLLDCLRELSRSVERHTKRDGRTGYLTFVKKFLP
jgi:hypothetical protein